MSKDIDLVWPLGVFTMMVTGVTSLGAGQNGGFGLDVTLKPLGGPGDGYVIVRACPWPVHVARAAAFVASA
jgi:hypothetical protein